MAMRITLQNKKYKVLNFSNVLTEKLELIGQQYEFPIDTASAMCKPQRCAMNSDQYFICSLPLQAELADRFDDIEDAVLKAMDTIERTSSMIKNLNGHVRKHIRNRKVIDQGYLDLLRFS
jgi:hypothetical protein